MWEHTPVVGEENNSYSETGVVVFIKHTKHSKLNVPLLVIHPPRAINVRWKYLMLISKGHYEQPLKRKKILKYCMPYLDLLQI